MLLIETMSATIEELRTEFAASRQQETGYELRIQELNRWRKTSALQTEHILSRARNERPEQALRFESILSACKTSETEYQSRSLEPSESLANIEYQVSRRTYSF